MASNSADPSIPIGSTVTAVGKKGIVRFVGETEFSTGVWVGIELDGPDGKNNGSVQGVRYFEVPQNHGLFVRIAQVELQTKSSEQEKDTGKGGAGAGTAASSRLAALRQKKAAALASREKIRGTGAGSSSDTKNPAPRKSLSGTVPKRSSSQPRCPASPSSSRQTAQKVEARQSESAPGDATPLVLQNEIDSLKEEVTEKSAEIEKLKAQLQEAQEKKSEEGPDPSDKSAIEQQLAESTKQVEELKLQLEEERRQSLAASDELRVLKDLKETSAAEEKGKVAEYARDKAALASALRKVGELENQIMELHDEMEVLTLDKETLMMEKEDVEEKLEEAKLEAEAAKLEAEHAMLAASEKAEVAGSGDQDITELQDQNTKMREALKKLAEISQTEKAELTKKIRALEKEAVQVPQLKSEIEGLKYWKEQTLVELTELQEQVDTGNAFEEMLETMTEKNLDLETKVSELSVKVEDLENTLELSEEIEQSQAQELKALQSDLDAMEVKVVNVDSIIAAKDKEVADAQATMEKFRALVEELQADRSTLADKAAAGEEELESLKGRAQGVLAQNLSLQSLATQRRKQRYLEATLKLKAAAAEAKASRWNLLLPVALREQEQVNLESEFLLARVVMKGLDAVSSLKEGMESWAEEARSGGKMDEQRAELWSHGVDVGQLILKGAMEAHTLLTFVVSPETEEKASAAASLKAREPFSLLENLVDGVLMTLSEEGAIPLHLSPSGDLEEALHNCKQVYSDLNLPWNSDQEQVKAAYSLQAAIAYAFGATAQAASIFGTEDSAAIQASLVALVAELQKLREKGDPNSDSKLPPNSSWTMQLENLRDTARALHVKLASFTSMHPDGGDAVGLGEDVQRIRGRTRELLEDDTALQSFASILDGSFIWSMLTPSSRQDVTVPFAVRAKAVNDTLQEAMLLKPELEAAHAEVTRLATELDDKEKELLSSTALRSNLEKIVEKETAQKIAAEEMLEELQNIRLAKVTLEKENKTLQEAVDVLTQQVTELDDEKRAMLKSGLQKGKKASSGSLTGSTRMDGGTGVSFEELGNLQAALRYSRTEAANWRAKATCTLLKDLEPLPKVVPPEEKYARQQGANSDNLQETAGAGDVSSGIATYLSSLSDLEKRVRLCRAAPKVVSLKKGNSRAQWYRMQVETGQLHKELSQTTANIQRLVRGLQSANTKVFFEDSKILEELGQGSQANQVVARLLMKSAPSKDFVVPNSNSFALGSDELRKLYSIFIPQ